MAYDKVRALAEKGFHDRRKTVIIIKGGPGTGKSVIAIKLMADLLWTLWRKIVVRVDRLLGANKIDLQLRQDLQGEIIS